MTTIKDLLSNTIWEDVSKNMETRKDYIYTKYKHHLERIYNDLKSLHIVNPIFNNIELYCNDLGWGFEFGVKFGEGSERHIDYLPWEVILGISVKEDTLLRESKETIITLLLNQIFSFGKSKIMSEVNTQQRHNEDWIVYTSCIPAPFYVFNEKDNRKTHMLQWAKEEECIIKIINGETKEVIYDKTLKDEYDDDYEEPLVISSLNWIPMTYTEAQSRYIRS
jgi:hypothetical protein